MTFNSVRSGLYKIAKYLGDLQAVSQANKKRSSKPIAKRIGRRLAGKATARMLSALFRKW